MADKQGTIPGVQVSDHPDVAEAAAALLRARAEQKEANDGAEKAGEMLAAAMHKAKIDAYFYDGAIFTLEQLEKLKVKSVG